MLGGLAFLILAGVVIFFPRQEKDSISSRGAEIISERGAEIIADLKSKLSQYPECPADLSGILTAPLMEPKYISALIPLGNINPPGHTSPVDHIYFDTNYDGKIPLYAPADAWITQATKILYADKKDKKYISAGYQFKYVLCQGLEIDLTEYSEIVPEIKTALEAQKPECKYGITKDGHDKLEAQCYYRLNLKVKSGQLLGYVQKKDGKLPFEIWAANYNKPARADVNWEYYEDDRYAHSMCLFDLYTGDLKKQFYEKFGSAGYKPGETFTPRTIEPLCGQVNQDIVGTIQGMWFGWMPKRTDNVDDSEKGLAFLHNNIDPRQAEISIGGNFMDIGVVMFAPQHSGLIDREPSEVKADNRIYCYNKQNNGENSEGKILVQLINDHRLKVEYQVGACNSNESFSKPFDYER